MSGALQKLREMCLKRGVNGIRSIGRYFRMYDDDGNKKLNKEEMTNGLKDCGLDLTPAEINEIFQYCDSDNSGSVNFDEFLVALRPPMSQARMDIINQAFAKMDSTGDGRITVEDLRTTYDVSNHPKVKSGEKSKDQLLQEFLNNFQENNDNVVTKEEWINYYAGVSASIDDDEYFVYMMKQAWKL